MVDILLAANFDFKGFENQFQDNKFNFQPGCTLFSLIPIKEHFDLMLFVQLRLYFGYHIVSFADRCFVIHKKVTLSCNRSIHFLHEALKYMT